MYLLHFATSILAQKAFIPLISWSLVVGLISLLMYSLSSCHKFSIGFRSGDSGGVFHQSMLFSKKWTWGVGCY